MIPSEINDPRIRILIVVLDWLTLVDIYDNWHLSCMIMNMSHNYKLNTLLLSWLLLFCLKVRNGLTYSIWKEALFHIMQVVKNYILGIQTHHRRGDVTWRPYQHVHCTLEIKSCLHFAFISSLIIAMRCVSYACLYYYGPSIIFGWRLTWWRVICSVLHIYILLSCSVYFSSLFQDILRSTLCFKY